MHPLRKLRESGKATPAQVSELLAENIVFKSPMLVRPIEGREVIAAIFAQSSSTRGSGTYTAEFKLDERTTFLRWEGTMDGHRIESFEVIAGKSIPEEGAAKVFAFVHRVDRPEKEELLKGIERVKWFLWHGNVCRALQVIEELEVDLDTDGATPPNRPGRA